MLASGFQANFNHQYHPIPPPSTCMNLTTTAQHEQALLQPPQLSSPNCPRCASTNTKFCYYNNYSLAQPRFFCKSCKRYWTRGGSLRNVPVGGGCRKTRRRSRRRSQSETSGDNINGNSSSSSPTGSDLNPTSRADIDLAAVFARYVNPDHTTTTVLSPPPQDPSSAAATSTSSSWSSASDLATRSEPDVDGVGTNSPGIIKDDDYLIQTTVADLLSADDNLLPETDDIGINNTSMEVDCFWDIPEPSAPENIECPLWSSSNDASRRGQSTTSVELISSAWELEQEFGLGMTPLMSTTAPGISYSDIDDVWLELDMFNPSSTLGNDIDGDAICAGFDQLPAAM